jgi:cell division protein FtsI/penicillin-binding protein 2
MCGAPDFDSNEYGNVESINVFNNPAIFDAYEPGSVFKPLTMAAAIDAGAVTPTTTFTDTGSVLVDGWPKPIGNAEGKVYGTVDMTKVLEDSINTGMIYAMRAMGMETFVVYVKSFGFGQYTGIELETENAGTIDSLDLGAEIYAATASFGQGITVTPLQIVMAYAAIANGGVLKAPLIVDEIQYADGTVEKRSTRDIAQVMDPKTARLVSAMLVSVIEHGHGKRAAVPGYYIGGKTGTAQVAKTDGIGYEQDNTIGSFAGFGPVEDPKFAMVVRIDNPKDVVWAESTAAPLFGEIAQFLLQYFEVPPVRSTE